MSSRIRLYMSHVKFSRRKLTFVINNTTLWYLHNLDESLYATWWNQAPFSNKTTRNERGLIRIGGTHISLCLLFVLMK